MDGLTPTQKRIVLWLPATPYELARRICGVDTPDKYDISLVHVHMSYLRRRVNGVVTRHWKGKYGDRWYELVAEEDPSRSRYEVDREYREHVALQCLENYLDHRELDHEDLERALMIVRGSGGNDEH